jgi:hypothetical protein
MVVCFTCGAQTKAQLDQLVATGHYHDHSEAISAAIQNLSVIHSEMKDARSIVIDRGSMPMSVDGEPKPGNEISSAAEPSPVVSGVTQRLESSAATRQAVGSPGIPALFHRQADVSMPTQFASVAAEQLSADQNIPIENWMFGQFNRLLPAKVTCRALANITADGGERQPLEKLATEIANEAAKFGKYLSALDQKRHLGRDDAMTVAFPKHPSEFKSIQRFANQFVGSTNREGQLLGLPASLKLIGTHPEFPQSIMLTEAGWKFGMLTNPILDGNAAAKIEKFGDEEITFLLDHIVALVPIEAFAYQTILSEVARGALTPDDLDAVLSKLSAQHKKGDPFVSTQRSGAISRMADLDLIGRSRTATRVSYVTTPRGDKFLRSQKLASLEGAKSSRRK